MRYYRPKTVLACAAIAPSVSGPPGPWETEVQLVTTLITDLDNTLFDWVDIWHRSFVAMFDEIVAISGVEPEILEKEFRQVHQRHGTSEYYFALIELPCLGLNGDWEEAKEKYGSALEARRKARDCALHLYPGVLDTLQKIKATGCTVIAYTESSAFYTMDRLKSLDLDYLIDYLYSPPDHDIPNGVDISRVRSQPQEHYELKHTVHRNTPRGELKPNVTILREIMNDTSALPERTAYVGDSRMKDITMAQAAGITDVWAEYGQAQDTAAYELLRRVTHWTDADVQRERNLRAAEPTHVLRESFAEIGELFRFGAAQFRRNA